MPLYDKNGTRILSHTEPKSDVILPDSSTDRLVSVQEAIQQNTEKMANEIAKQNGSYARKLLFEAVKALIVAITTLAVEHIFDIWAFIEPFFQRTSPPCILGVMAMVGLGLSVSIRVWRLL